MKLCSGLSRSTHMSESSRAMRLVPLAEALERRVATLNS